MFCKDCNKEWKDGYGAPLEERLDLCVPCIELRAGKVDELEIELASMEEVHTGLRKALKTAELKVEQFNGLMYAEQAGMTSAENGLGEDQNPFKVEEERHIMWLAGWTAVDTRRRGLQAEAVMTWSVGMLETLIDLARGYDQQEIATKIGLVVSKYRDIVVAVKE